MDHDRAGDVATLERPPHILVVDDDESVRRSVTRALRYEGFRVTSVGSGEDALKAIEQDHDDFDVVVSDIVMRGISGVTLCNAVRAIKPAAKIILISGFPGDHLSDQAAGAAQFDLLEKPFTPAQLTGRVRRALQADGA